MVWQLPMATKHGTVAFGAGQLTHARIRIGRVGWTRFQAAGVAHLLIEYKFAVVLVLRVRLACQSRLLFICGTVAVARRRVAPSRFAERLTLVSEGTSVGASNWRIDFSANMDP